jgi:hypothetical protein
MRPGWHYTHIPNYPAAAIPKMPANRDSNGQKSAINHLENNFWTSKLRKLG